MFLRFVQRSEHETFIYQMYEIAFALSLFLSLDARTQRVYAR